MLCKSLEFKNVIGQKIKVIEIPVVEKNSRYYFMVQLRLQIFISCLYQKHQVKRCYSFREYLKRKLSWPDYIDLYRIQDFKSNA
nr:YpmP family protein [Neobacillus sp. Marseille-Q6967]